MSSVFPNDVLHYVRLLAEGMSGYGPAILCFHCDDSPQSHGTLGFALHGTLAPPGNKPRGEVPGESWDEDCPLDVQKPLIQR